MLCRNHTDCSWLNKDLRVSIMFRTLKFIFLLQCSNYNLGFTPDAKWFDGDSASIIGQVESNLLLKLTPSKRFQCECIPDRDWDEIMFRCHVSLGLI